MKHKQAIKNRINQKTAARKHARRKILEGLKGSTAPNLRIRFKLRETPRRSAPVSKRKR